MKRKALFFFFLTVVVLKIYWQVVLLQGKAEPTNPVPRYQTRNYIFIIGFIASRCTNNITQDRTTTGPKSRKMAIGGGWEERSGCCRGSKVTYQNKNRMEYKTSWWLGGKRESERERKKVKLWEWRSQNFVLIFRVQSNFGFDSLSFSLSPQTLPFWEG